MELYILRHGKAENRSSITSDFERNLTVIGREEVQEIATSLRGIGVRLDHTASSPLNRAIQTAEIVAKKICKNKIMRWDELKPEGSISEVHNKLSELPSDSRVMIVGHEPSLSGIMTSLMGGGDDAYRGILLKKAGLARISVSSAGARLSGDLLWLLTPKLLRRLG